ncbi:fumarate hydratase [Candidatus Omnitrophota bacterium]
MKRLEFIEKKVDEAVARANFEFRPDVLKAIKQAWRREKNKLTRQALGWIIENAAIAKAQKLALCQDSGLAVVFIQAGRDIALTAKTVETITLTVERSYRRHHLRNSLVDPLVRGKPGYQGVRAHVDFDSRQKGLRITVFPKGFGSENKAKLRMFDPTAPLAAIEDFVLDTVKQAGPEACPPFVVGVGIGGTSDQALLSAKRVLCEDISKPNRDRDCASLERRILQRIQALKIGPMGFGGPATALAVKIKKEPTHIAGLPVGVNVSCWALRSATAVIR